MKKVALLCVVVLVAAGALAAPPSKILVKYDVYRGYGEALITALKTKWSGATISSYMGNTWAAFDSQLVSGTWNVVIVEGHNYRGSSSTQYQHLADWYNKGVGPLFYTDWYMYGSLNNVLEAAMGAGNGTRLAMPPRPHYAWVTTHPICSGITNWSYGNPGYGTGGNAMPWTTASPVTGWTTTQTAGQGGIMIAPKKYSIISGYMPSLNLNQGEKIWANILDYMWSNYTSVAPASLGKVKAMYK